MKSLLIAFVLLLFPYIVFGQIKAKENTRTDLIVYRVFDSLDDYLAKEIAKRSLTDTVQAIIIDPVCRLERSIILDHNEAPIENMIYFSVLYKSKDYRDTVIEKTNRYILIGGNLYPAYIYYIDNILTVNRRSANRPHNSGEIGVNAHLADGHIFGVVADMARKQYYLLSRGSKEMTVPLGVRKNPDMNEIWNLHDD